MIHIIIVSTSILPSSFLRHPLINEWFEPHAQYAGYVAGTMSTDGVSPLTLLFIIALAKSIAAPDPTILHGCHQLSNRGRDPVPC